MSDHRSQPMDLASPAIWESYWATHIQLPKTYNPAVALDRCIGATVERFLAPDPTRTMLEVGCCPGKWMIYFHQTFGYRVSGIDYLPIGIAYTRQNLALSQVACEELIQADVVGWQTDQRYDVVFSVGFVEHFTDVELVLQSHLDLTTPGGYMLVGWPRFHGLLYRLQAYFDSFSRFQVLPWHNLASMDLAVLRDFAARHPVQVCFLGYIGGWLPTLLKTGDAGRRVKAARDTIVRWRDRRRWLDQINHPLISDYLFAVFQRPE